MELFSLKNKLDINFTISLWGGQMLHCIKSSTEFFGGTGVSLNKFFLKMCRSIKVWFIRLGEPSG